MIVQCPNCATKYNLPESKFKPGAKAKCTVCGHHFPLTQGGSEKKPQPAPKPQPQPKPPMEEKSVDDLLNGIGDQYDPLGDIGGREDEVDDFGLSGHFDEVDQRPEPPRPPKRPTMDDVEDFARGDSQRDENLDELRDSLNLDLDGGARKKKKKKKSRLLWLLIVLLLLTLFGMGGYYAVTVYAPELLDRVMQSTGSTETDRNQPKPAVIPTSQVKNIVLSNVKQYYVNNEKIGRVIVIEGTVVNNFAEVKDSIKVEAALYDKDGAVLTSKEVYCGPTASLFQLRVMSQEELEAHLSNRVAIVTQNTNIKPGGSVPFMAAFYNPPETVSEYGVNVTQALDPPK